MTCDLFGVWFYAESNNNKQTHFEVERLKWVRTDGPNNIYTLEREPRHLYQISNENKIVGTLYNLTPEEEEQVENLIDEFYEGQAEYKFIYGEEDSRSSFEDEAYRKLFGSIMYTSFISITPEGIKSYVFERLEKEFTKASESNVRTVKMYTDDNEKVKTSFTKVTSDACTVVDPIIGTKFYKYINSVGVFTYEVVEILSNKGMELYKLKCNSCNHSDVCEVIISKIYSDSYGLVKVCDEDNSHKHYHFDPTFFHTDKKKAYLQYKERIVDYNDKVLANLKRVESIHQLFLKASKIN